jgi:hypothetical protein
METPVQKFSSFKEFYPFYLSQHQDPTSRRLHFIGLLAGIVWAGIVVLLGYNYSYIVLSLLMGYGAGFVGHFVFEKNKPATFRNPFYSFLADFTMMKDILTGKVPF